MIVFARAFSTDAEPNRQMSVPLAGKRSFDSVILAKDFMRLEI